jgi:F-type H+-transporting ATPase subunit epsilon
LFGFAIGYWYTVKMNAIKKMRVDIVSMEQEIFSGEADQVIATGAMGELGILPGHTPLLTSLKPGVINLTNNGQEEVFFVSGGTLEVQPNVITILADVIARAKDLDEVAAMEAKKRAEKMLQDRKMDVDYYAAAAELAEAIAQLRAIRKIRK